MSNTESKINLNTSGFVLKWNQDHTKANLRDKGFPILFKTGSCLISIGRPNEGTRYVNVALKSNDEKFKLVFTYLKEKLTELLEGEQLNNFIYPNNDNSYTVYAKLFVDESKRLLATVYDPKDKLINERTSPSITVDKLLKKYNIYPGNCKVLLRAAGVSRYENTYFIGLFVETIFLETNNVSEEICIDIENL